MTQLSEEGKISATILRYFNVSGADEKMRSGLMSNPDNLIKAICEVATKKRDKLNSSLRTAISLIEQLHTCFRISLHR